MEFLPHDIVADLLESYRIAEEPEGEDKIFLRMTNGEGVQHFHLRCGESESTARPTAIAGETTLEKIPRLVEHVLHHLHINEVILIPVGKWRQVFDAVAFSLADNEHWQEVDAAASVALNTRDPLFCGPKDFPLLDDLIKALLKDADEPQQGFVMISRTSPLLIEIIPDGAFRISVGNQPMADEVSGVLNA